ncbi:MAG: DUF6364 family protein [Firmicutes bacterium]|nr:DUF6364 family protein [Bacillota bacterium]
MKPLKTSINITLDEDLLTKIKEYAEQEDRSVSSYINQLIKKHVKEMEYED